jgi:hypothetical protein
MQLILLISWWWTRNVSETCRELTGNKVLWRDICWLFLDKVNLSVIVLCSFRILCWINFETKRCKFRSFGDVTKHTLRFTTTSSSTFLNLCFSFTWPITLLYVQTSVAHYPHSVELRMWRNFLGGSDLLLHSFSLNHPIHSQLCWAILLFYVVPDGKSE